MPKKITHGSTFSGIGAPEIAAEMLGWENAFHCEINPFGRRILDYYYPNAKSYVDITNTDFSEWRGRIDVLTGGFPCQPFSYAGKRKGSQDDRYLWPYMLKCIEQVRPTWFIGENVGGIGTMVFPGEEIKVGSSADIFEPGDIYRKEERYVLYEIIQNLESVGYAVQSFIIPACAVGAPHRRDRVFIVAHCNAADPSLMFGNGGEFGKRRGPKEIPELGNSGSEDVPSTHARMLPSERWRDFPTVSPIYRGNDGLPFDVDSLAIPMSEWKRESLKAYGNAIVPQVMYEIFRAIEVIEKTQ